MDHPLIHEGQKTLRRRVVQFFQNAYTVRRFSNIVFVCGGNEDAHMRMLFRAYCRENMPEYEIFLPEAAMENIFSGDAREPFDLADFEQLVGELSHAVVVFPEAPGSFAETGYFSAIKPLSRKCILVLDSNRQKKDSFISLGPAKKISSDSIFQPPIQLNYEDPNFAVISERIRRVNKKKYRKTLEISKFSDHSSFEIASLIHGIISICSVSTIYDVIYMMRSLFKGHLSIGTVRKLTSILVGSGYLKEIGDYGHVTINYVKPNLLEIKDGFRDEEAGIRLSLANAYQSAEPEFIRLVEESRHVD